MGFHKRRILTALARVVLFAFTTNIAFAYKPEENIWKDRAVQVASLPFTPLATSPLTSLHLSSSRPAQAGKLQPGSMTTDFSQGYRMDSVRHRTDPPLADFRRNDGLANYNLLDSFFAHVNIRDAYQGKNPLSVVLLEDVHMNKEAQTHLSQTLKSFADTPGHEPVFVGLEGAEGELLYDTYQKFSNHEIATQVADSFFESGEISGPAHAGFTTYPQEGARGLHFWGVDQDSLYQANIQAYKDSKKIKPQVQKQIARKC